MSARQGAVWVRAHTRGSPECMQITFSLLAKDRSLFPFWLQKVSHLSYFHRSFIYIYVCVYIYIHMYAYIHAYIF